MTASIATTAESFIPELLELDDREQQIRQVLSACFGHDREVERAHVYINAQLGDYDRETGKFGRDVVVARPLFICDAATAELTIAAELAVRLIGPVTRLVDQALDFDEHWKFYENWSDAKQMEKIRALFARAGIPERFVP